MSPRRPSRSVTSSHSQPYTLRNFMTEERVCEACPQNLDTGLCFPCIPSKSCSISRFDLSILTSPSEKSLSSYLPDAFSRALDSCRLTCLMPSVVLLTVGIIIRAPYKNKQTNKGCWCSGCMWLCVSKYEGVCVCMYTCGCTVCA